MRKVNIIYTNFYGEHAFVHPNMYNSGQNCGVLQCFSFFLSHIILEQINISILNLDEMVVIEYLIIILTVGIIFSIKNN